MYKSDKEKDYSSVWFSFYVFSLVLLWMGVNFMMGPLISHTILKVKGTIQYSSMELCGIKSCFQREETWKTLSQSTVCRIRHLKI